MVSQMANKGKRTRKDMVGDIEKNTRLINECNEHIRTNSIIKRISVAEREAAISELCSSIKGIDPAVKRRERSIPAEILSNVEVKGN